jgi:hypothetical protein
MRGPDFDTSATVQFHLLMSRRAAWIAALSALFAGRLLFGLTSEFWAEDETQIYLTGLRYYATGDWPYFGADVVWTMSQIPGALQPLLVGLPLRIAPLPEAPFVLLNLLSFAALCALAAYVCRRLPSLPAWLVWGWLLTAPWTLQFSTHVYNPSYVLPAAVVFFLAFFEAVPALSLGILSPRVAFAMMGAAMTWIMQIHMSWPLLLPYAAVALYSRSTQSTQSTQRTQRSAVSAFSALYIRHATWLVAGAAVPALLLAPTFLEYGLRVGSGGSASNLHVRVVSPASLLVTLAQFFSFASLEINRFVANDNAKRWVFLQEHVWLAPLVVVALAAGVVQPIWMLASWFRRASGRLDWLALRKVVAATVVLVYVSYWFVREEPQAHAFYVVAPIAFVYAAYCWSFIDRPRWRRVAAFALGVNIALHAGLAWTQASQHSLYTNRDVIATAIRQKEPQMFGHRRPFALAAGPRALDDPSRPYHMTDLTVDEATVSLAVGRSAVWHVTVTNRNPRVAFRNLIYVATYVDGEGREVQRHEDVIKDVLQPGESRRFTVVDTIVAAPFQHATFVIPAAEALLPSRP